MTDLTKITTPFGLLDPETQEALKAHGGPYEVYFSVGWESVASPFWAINCCYRVKPQAPDETARQFGGASGMSRYLPNGQVWLGFDDGLICVAVSIEKRMPDIRRKSAFEGCSAVVKCHVDRGDRVFGRHLSSFNLVKHEVAK